MQMEVNKLINKSISYYNSQKYSDAIKLLEKEIFFYKNYYFYHYILGMSYLRMGNLGNAQTYLKKAYTLNPTEPDVKQSIAILLAAQGKEDKAIQIWLKMIEENQEIERSELSLETIRKNPIQGALFLNRNKIYARLFPKLKVKTGQNLSKLIRILIIIAGLAFLLIAIFLIIHSNETIKLPLSVPNINTKKILTTLQHTLMILK